MQALQVGRERVLVCEGLQSYECSQSPTWKLVNEEYMRVRFSLRTNKFTYS